MTDSSAGRHLPSGTVTFLFTDIEGSTKLAQQYPEGWEALRARHHTILQAAMDAHHGYVFQIIGDAFCVAFHTASDGLKAAAEAQRNLQCEDWGETPIKVRMGLHTGSAELHGADYRGYLTMAKVQRVMSVAYGGQVLVSNSSAELLQDGLPAEVTLRDMKEHRLKGLPGTEHLWQMVTPDLPQDFPPLQSAAEIPNNLPVQLTSFVGRGKEIDQIKNRLEKNRLVTLTGSGGVGKTRLSVQVAFELLSEFPNGVWLVELAPITDPVLVTRAICTALDVTPQGNTPVLNVLTDYLKHKKLLLVLDNCEHLIDACAKLCDLLLHTCPNLRILASSREALGTDGENAYHVPSLSLPEAKSAFSDLEKSEAVKLFAERAVSVVSDFELTESNAPIVARICQRLDGIALAIELAASRVKMLNVEQIASRLDDTFRLLTGGSRTALPRQQTLRALIDWSYNLLSEEEKATLLRLSVFVGGWTLEAAESICRNPNVLDLLTHLADKSLVTVDLEHGGEPRYYLLETIRQYAREKLSEAGEAGPIRDQHLAYFLAFARRAEPQLVAADQRMWFDRLELELDNFRAAFEWSLDSGERGAEAGLQMANSLWWFWFLCGYDGDVKWLRKMLVASQDSTDLVTRAIALSRLSWADFFDEAAANEGLALGRTLGAAGRESVAVALLMKGAWAVYQADYAQGKLLADESLKLFRELGHRWGMCEALTWQGLSLIDMGDPQPAIAPLEESLALARQARDGNEIGFALWQLGRAAMAQHAYVEATKFMSESLGIFKELRLNGGVTFVLDDLGKTALAQTDYKQASSHYKEALAIYWDRGSERAVAGGLEQLAGVAVMCQQSARAARLMGAAEALRQSSDKALFPFEMANYESTLKLLHSQLDEPSFARCWSEGRTMNVKEAVKYALEEDS